MTKAALVVDDPSLRSAIAFALEALGLRVDTYRDLGGIVDGRRDEACLIIDIEPSGADPVGCLRELHRHEVRAPVIVLAGSPSPHLRREIAAAGATLVEKPLLTDALPATIGALLQRARGSGDGGLQRAGEA